MAGQLVPVQAFLSNGTPAASAKMKLEAAGTTTPKAAYADEAGTQALPNPVIANAYGIMYLWLKSGIGDYKLTLTASDGVTLLMDTVDNFTPTVSSIYQIIGENLKTIKDAAVTAQAAAEAAKAAAELAATNSQTSATASASSATASATSATNSANSATASASSATSAATSATNSANSATASSTSATNSASSATAAATSATNSASSATTATTKAAESAAWSDAAVDAPVEGVTGDKIIFDPTTAVNLTTNIITINAHGLRNWQQVTYRHGGGTVIGGLTQDAEYWAAVIDANTFTLSATRYGSTIDLTSAGTGTVHELYPKRSSKHNAAYAEADSISAEASSLSATQTLALMMEIAKPGTYANAAAVVAAYPGESGYFYRRTDQVLYFLSDDIPPTDYLYVPATEIAGSADTLAALKAHTTTTIPAAVKFVVMGGYDNLTEGGGALFAVLRGSAASFNLTADDVTVIENTGQTLTFRRASQALGVNLVSMGARPNRTTLAGAARAQADYESNDTVFTRWQTAKVLGLFENMVGFWTAKTPTDAFKAHGQGGFMPVVVSGGDPQTEGRAKASGLFYAGGTTTAPFLWLAHSAAGIEPTGTDVNIEGLSLKDIHIDGGSAKYALAGVRCGYGASIDNITLTGGTDRCMVLNGVYGLKAGRISIARCPNIGVSIGENVFDFANDKYCFDIRAELHVVYAGYDSAGVAAFDYTVVRATLNAPDGSETVDNSAETRRYLVGTAPTGAFAGQANKIAEWTPGAPGSWAFVTKASGAIVYDMTAHNALLSNGTTWAVDNTKIEKGAGVILLTARQADDAIRIASLERCAGFGAIVSVRDNAGPGGVVIDYLERNAAGVLIPYENKTNGLRVRVAFANPGSTFPDQAIVIRGQSSVAGHTSAWLSSATVLADAGPDDEAEYLVIEGFYGRNSSDNDGLSVYSNTGKYFVYARDAKVFYGDKVPRNYVDTAQTAVYVDASAGHDAYPGTSAKPLKTLPEALRRRLLNPLINTINMIGTFTGQSADLGGQKGGTVTIDGGTAANLNQSADNVDAVLIKGKGCRLKLQNFANIGKLSIYNADVEIQGSITAASTAAAAHYGLWVDEDSNVLLVGSVNADAARGIRVDNSRLTIFGAVTNYAAGLSVIVNDGAEIISNALSTDANALSLIGPNATTGAGSEGFARFKDGVTYSYENAAFHLQFIEGTDTATLVGATTAGTTGNTATFNYHRMGKRVSGFVDLNTTTFDGTGNLSITLGLLPVAGHRQIMAEAQNWRVSATGANYYIYGVIDAGANVINLYKEVLDGTTDATAVRLVDTDLSGAAGSWDARFIINFDYWTA